ncbi:MAG: FAD-binding oxidoreductase [Deltaproteobacteria bacterium]|nr:FAD-binding oxidoreductase [Deltaproteobacteria bacterium]
MSRKTTAADVVVIGGGVIGTAVAYFLAKCRMDVTLIERGGIACGTSGRCEGNVLVQDKLPGFDCQLAKLSQELFPVVAREIDIDIGWTRKGSLLVIESEEELEAAAVFCGQMAAEGLPVRMLDAYAVHEDEPNLASDIVGGLEFACDGTLNPMALSQGLSLKAEQLGAVMRTYTTVTGIRLDSSGGICGVDTDCGSILTPRIVNAAGIWAPHIGKMIDLDIPVKPRKGQVLVSERTFQVARRTVIEFGYLMAKFGKGDYQRRITPEMEKYGIAFVFEPTDAGNFLIGSSRQFTDTDTTVDVHVLKAMAQRAIRFFPVIQQIQIIRSYAGFRPYTPDHFPIVSETRVPGFYVAAGHEGDGIGLSLITGKLMAQIITREPTDIAIEPLRLDRFEGRAFLNQG